jgi:hypothetical protein
LVKDLGVILKGLKPMGTPLRDIEHPAIVYRQLHRYPLFEGGRIWAEIDNHIVNGSHRASNQLGFFTGLDLVVHATERALLLIIRNATLHQSGIESMCFAFGLTPGSRKKAALVF